jgi:hypothetical protein
MTMRCTVQIIPSVNRRSDFYSHTMLRKSIIVVEDFYQDPDVVREYALRQQYYFPYQADDDVKSRRKRFSWMTSWFREATKCPFKSSRQLLARLEAITGESIDIDHWNLSFPIDNEGKAADSHLSTPHSCFWNCCFHMKPLNNQPLGEGVHNHVTDRWNSVGEDGWTGLVYLSREAPVSGGLKLWRNRDPSRNFDWMTSRENWELIDDLGNIYNRLLLCRGNLPHSGAAGWGDRLENGRFYQTFFFRQKPSNPMRSLIIDL